jgi:hypothetical protein
MDSASSIAARLRISIDELTMSRLYNLGVIRPATEVEDLLSALPFLAEAAMKHGLRLSR